MLWIIEFHKVFAQNKTSQVQRIWPWIIYDAEQLWQLWHYRWKPIKLLPGMICFGIISRVSLVLYLQASDGSFQTIYSPAHVSNSSFVCFLIMKSIKTKVTWGSGACPRPFSLQEINVRLSDSMAAWFCALICLQVHWSWAGRLSD